MQILTFSTFYFISKIKTLFFLYNLFIALFNSCSVVVIPYSLLKAVESGNVFRKENLVAGDAEFYHIPETDYFIRKYDARIAQKIADGLLTVDNSCIIGSKQIFMVRLIHIKKQMAKRNVINISDNFNIGGYIFLYNKETKIPATDVTRIYFSNPNNDNKWMQLNF